MENPSQVRSERQELWKRRKIWLEVSSPCLCRRSCFKRRMMQRLSGCLVCKGSSSELGWWVWGRFCLGRGRCFSGLTPQGVTLAAQLPAATSPRCSCAWALLLGSSELVLVRVLLEQNSYIKTKWLSSSTLESGCFLQNHRHFSNLHL